MMMMMMMIMMGVVIQFQIFIYLFIDVLSQKPISQLQIKHGKRGKKVKLSL
jgi:hypothetical protein